MELHFVGYLYIMGMINAQKMEIINTTNKNFFTITNNNLCSISDKQLCQILSSLSKMLVFMFWWVNE